MVDRNESGLSRDGARKLKQRERERERGSERCHSIDSVRRRKCLSRPLVAGAGCFLPGVSLPSHPIVINSVFIMESGGGVGSGVGSGVGGGGGGNGSKIDQAWGIYWRMPKKGPKLTHFQAFRAAS